MQKTISKDKELQGVGVHSGAIVSMIFKPAAVDSGIIFVRTDIGKDGVVAANYKNVCDVRMSTTIGNGKATISTIEHLMAAIWGCGIDNLIVEIDGPEVPVMDGSSKLFAKALQEAGVVMQDKPIKILQLTKEIKVSDGDSIITAHPAKHLSLNVSIDFENPAIGQQSHSCTSEEQFMSESQDARTFGFVKDLEMLQKMGLARGASLDNAIAIDGERVINPEGLRHENEFARHKLLDLIGDLFCCGSRFNFKLDAHKPSHGLNNKFLHEIFSDPKNFEIVS